MIKITIHVPEAYNYKAETVKRAETFLDILFNRPELLNQRETDRCFECYDGAEVWELVTASIDKNNIKFEGIPLSAQYWFREDMWEKTLAKYREKLSAQTTLSL